ncbi:hypothetical protein ACWZHB_22365 [Nocardia sp. FBN12]
MSAKALAAASELRAATAESAHAAQPTPGVVTRAAVTELVR